MKKQFFSLAAITALALGFTSCSNGANDIATTDSTTTTTTTTGTETTMASSTGNYAAMADSVEKNSEQGYYLNPKTGKAYGKLTVDRSTGRVTTEAGEPVWRYVDRRNWWVYGGNDWSQEGEAKMEGDKLMYKGDGDKWVDYDTRWMKEDEENMKKWKESDAGNKQKMVTEDGDKIKVKNDEEGNTKIKVNGEKVKVDSNGNLKKQ
ncbi:hypothetical protein [Flavisolibacter nicotianae]|uniref:hypothetical protein n=1 Tax=Flavisolibacter nicotianae TaxID=2364882 RepID=UPI000EB57EE7|nr:hypothetical protein [Flavisolibacter nicotianae]